MEPQADDYDNNLCQSPEAFDQVVERLDKVEFDSTTHHTTTLRIAKIIKAKESKFGKKEDKALINAQGQNKSFQHLKFEFI